MVRQITYGCLGLLLFLAWPPAWGQEFDCASVDQPPLTESFSHRERLNALAQNGCLGGPRDQATLTQAITDILPAQDGASPAERQALTLKALGQLRGAVDARIEQVEDNDPFNIKARLQTLASAILAARQAVAEAKPGDTLARPGYWQYNPNAGTLSQPPQGELRIDLMLFEGFLTAACGPQAEPACDQVYAAAKTTLRHARLVRRTLTFYTQTVIDAHYADALHRDRMWQAYFDQARFQYPWELLANGWWLQRHDPRPRDEAGNRLGFLAPPNDQWILLHPNVGLEYVAEAADGSQLEPAVFIELVGYNRWRWSQTGHMQGGLGVSAIASYADRADAQDLGYGIMLHWRHTWSLAVTTRDGDVGTMLSADVAQAVGRVSDQARQWLRLGSD